MRLQQKTRYLHSLKISSHKIVIKYKEKIATSQWKNLTDTTLTKLSNLASPEMGQSDLMYLLI